MEARPKRASFVCVGKSRRISPFFLFPASFLLPVICLFCCNFCPIKFGIFQEKCTRFTHEISIISEFRFQRSAVPQNLAAQCMPDTSTNISKKFSNNCMKVQEQSGDCSATFRENLPRFQAKRFKAWGETLGGFLCANGGIPQKYRSRFRIRSFSYDIKGWRFHGYGRILPCLVATTLASLNLSSKDFRRLSSRVSQSMFDTAFIFLNCKSKNFKTVRYNHRHP